MGHSSCPPLKEYDKLFQSALAKEIEEMLYRYPYTLRALSDYGITRDQIRACLEKNKIFFKNFNATPKQR